MVANLPFFHSFDEPNTHECYLFDIWDLDHLLRVHNYTFCLD